MFCSVLSLGLVLPRLDNSEAQIVLNTPFELIHTCKLLSTESFILKLLKMCLPVLDSERKPDSVVRLKERPYALPHVMMMICRRICYGITSALATATVIP